MRTISAVVIVLSFSANPSQILAHHSGYESSVASAKCGWIDGDSLRDRRNLADFCDRGMPGELRISNASAMRERLWIEAPPDLVSVLRDDNRTTAALLQKWLEQWRKTTGYATASVILLQKHVEFARIQTTMRGDVVVIQ